MEAAGELDELPALAVLAAARRRFPSAEAATACQASAGAGWPYPVWEEARFTSAESAHKPERSARADPSWENTPDLIL
jgi:hypothetical protein